MELGAGCDAIFSCMNPPVLPEQLHACLAFYHQLIEAGMFHCNTHNFYEVNCMHLKADSKQSLNPPDSTSATTSIALI